VETCVITFPPKTNSWNLRGAPLDKENHRHKPPTCGLHVSFLGCNLFYSIIFATLRGFEDLNLNGYSISTTLEFSPRRINVNTHFIPWTTSPNKRWWVQQRLISKNTHTLQLSPVVFVEVAELESRCCVFLLPLNLCQHMGHDKGRTRRDKGLNNTPILGAMTITMQVFLITPSLTTPS